MNYKDLDTLLAALNALAAAEDYVNQHDWPDEYSVKILLSLSYINDAKANLAAVIKEDGFKKARSAKTLVESKQNA